MLDKYRFLLILSFATHFHEEGCVYVVIKRNELVKMQHTTQRVERPGGSQEA